MSLRSRINILVAALMLLFIVVIGGVMLQDMRRQIREEIEASTRVTVQLLTGIIYSSQFVPLAETQHEMLLGFLSGLKRVRANEIRLYDPLERLVYKSPPSTYKAGRSAPPWFERLVGPRVSDVELGIRGGRLVVSPDASRAVLDAWDDLRNLSGIAVAFFILTNALVFWAIGRALRPIRVVRAGLSEMGRGRLDVRLPSLGSTEFNAIAETFNRMAADLEKSSAENRRLALIASQSSDAIMIHDMDGIISYWNPAAERLFGYAAGEIRGQPAAMLAPPERAGELARQLETVRARGVVEHLETQRVARDGRLLDVALSAAPMVDPADDRVIGEICSMRDITEAKRARQAENELRQARELSHLLRNHVEEERRALARELHDELGQSVTAIQTIGASIAKRSADSMPEIHKSAQAIVEVAGRIYGAVHGIIGQLRPPSLDHQELAEALRDAVDDWRQRHPEVALELALGADLDGLDDELNITVYRIVQECLTNVARHSGATRVRIAVGRNGGGEGAELRLEVEDNGRGAAVGGADQRPRFGLAGIRERVQELRGKVEIDGAPGEGFRVCVMLPIAEARQAQEESA